MSVLRSRSRRGTSVLVAWCCAVVAFAGVIATPRSAEAQTEDVNGDWAGLRPAGGFFYDNGTCSQDIGVTLNQVGDTFSGEIGWTSLSSSIDRCAGVLSSEAGPVFFPSSVTGAISGNTVTMVIIATRLSNGVPLAVAASFLTGTIVGDQMSLTGTMVGPRSWTDFNGNSTPDCDLMNPAITTHECGTAPTRAITLIVSRVTPTYLLSELVDLVFDTNLAAGVSNSLDTKLEAALAAIVDANSNNDVAAINSMHAFVNSVEAQRDKQLTAAQADQLIDLADQILRLLGG